MSKLPIQVKLTDQQYANLFWQLHRFEDAGIPVFEALAFLEKSEKCLLKPLQLLQQRLKRGAPISEAGYKVGIFNTTQQALINAGESSGKLADVYKQLAGYYEGRSRRNKRIKSRLYFPAVILTIALFVNPLPALVAGSISLSKYLQLSLGSLLSILFGLWLLGNLSKLASIFGLETSWHSLQLKTPILSAWLITRQLNEFFFILAIMLEAGLAFSTALPKAVATIPNSQLRRYFQPALGILKTGVSVSEVLEKVVLIKPQILSIIKNSEISGKLSKDLLHFTKIEAEAISLADDALAEWLPRLVYSVIAVWMAYSIIASHSMAMQTLSGQI